GFLSLLPVGRSQELLGWGFGLVEGGPEQFLRRGQWLVGGAQEDRSGLFLALSLFKDRQNAGGLLIDRSRTPPAHQVSDGPDALSGSDKFQGAQRRQDQRGE